MSTGKRKISIRKVIQTLVTIVVVAGFSMAVISADRSQSRKKLGNVDIKIRNGEVVHFVDEEEVMNLLFKNRHLDPQDMSLGSLDIHKMENIARSNPWVSDAQVYVDNERNMHIIVTQRVPVVRIFEESGHSYYLDADLKAMPLSEKYVHYTPLITGAPSLRENDSVSRDIKGTMLGLVSYITRSKFWNAQIAQIVINRDRTFELIPILGKQRILLGDTSRVPEKLNNLLAFYQQVENKVGWEKYEVIDLRFKGQVVASPALAWKIPVDRALTNMNWVKAVMESAPKDDKDESVTNALDTGIASTGMATDNIVTPKPDQVSMATTAAYAAKVKPQTAKPAVTVVSPVKKPEAPRHDDVVKPKPAATVKPKETAPKKPVAVKPKEITPKKPVAITKPPVKKPGTNTAAVKPKPATPTVAKKNTATGIRPAASPPKKTPTPKKDDKKPVKPKTTDKQTVARKPAKPAKPAAAHH